MTLNGEKQPLCAESLTFAENNLLAILQVLTALKRTFLPLYGKQKTLNPTKIQGFSFFCFLTLRREGNYNLCYH